MSAPEAIPVAEGSQRAWNLDTGDFKVSELYFDADVTLAPHRHERACLSFLVEGAMEKRFAPTYYEIESPSLITIPLGERHSDWFGRHGTRIVVVEVVPDLVARQPAVEPGIRLLDDIIERRNEHIDVFARRLSREVRAPDELSPLAVSGLVFELVTMLGRPLEVRDRGSRAIPGWIPKVVDFLATNSSQQVRIEDIAREVDLHPGYLARTFRQHMGVPLGAFARDIRLDRVVRELANTDRRILDIALDAGFTDQSHLTRAFRKRFGVTPGEYRTLTR